MKRCRPCLLASMYSPHEQSSDGKATSHTPPSTSQNTPLSLYSYHQLFSSSARIHRATKHPPSSTDRVRKRRNPVLLRNRLHEPQRRESESDSEEARKKNNRYHPQQPGTHVNAVLAVHRAVGGKGRRCARAAGKQRVLCSRRFVWSLAVSRCACRQPAE